MNLCINVFVSVILQFDNRIYQIYKSLLLYMQAIQSCCFWFPSLIGSYILARLSKIYSDNATMNVALLSKYSPTELCCAPLSITELFPLCNFKQRPEKCTCTVPIYQWLWLHHKQKHTGDYVLPVYKWSESLKQHFVLSLELLFSLIASIFASEMAIHHFYNSKILLLLWLIIKRQDLSLGVCYFPRHQNSPSVGPACSLFCHAWCCDAGSVWNAGSCGIPRPTRSQGGKMLLETVFACIALMLPDGLMTPCCVCCTVSGGWWN